MRTPRILAFACLVLAAPFAHAQLRAVNPRINEITTQVSEARIETIIRRLVDFGTRNTLSSQDDPERGIGAARRWLFKQFQSYSPRLQVRFDQYKVKQRDERIFRDTDLYNVVAVLPGKVHPERQIVISAHYDSLNLVPKDGAPAGQGERSAATADWKKVDVNAPGANDDGSGVAAVLELARILSQYEFEKTIVFVAFAGEEQALVGSTLYAARARNENQVIEAVLNNDIIGNDRGTNGFSNASLVNAFSGDQQDSPSQALGRYARAIAERYLPSLTVNVVFQLDRFGRGGDHSPFQAEGFAAIRFTTAHENLVDQHSPTDTIDHMSIPYAARVTRLNAAVAASLALAPEAPIVNAPPRAGATNRASLPLISRGQTRNDAQLRWSSASPEADLAGYSILIRSTTSAFWEREIFVGKVNEYTLPDLSIDDLRFGVKAIDRDGNESLVSPYVYPNRPKAEIAVY